MPKPRAKGRKKLYMVGAELPRSEYEKVQRIARLEDRSVSSILRKLVAALPDPVETSAEGA
jgi:hypothetical protein